MYSKVLINYHKIDVVNRMATITNTIVPAPVATRLVSALAKAQQSITILKSTKSHSKLEKVLPKFTVNTSRHKRQHRQ